MKSTDLESQKDIARSCRKVYAVDKNALSSEPIYKQMRAIGKRKKRSKLESFFLLDISKVFKAF